MGLMLENGTTPSGLSPEPEKRLNQKAKPLIPNPIELE